MNHLVRFARWIPLVAAAAAPAQPPLAAEAVRTIAPLDDSAQAGLGLVIRAAPNDPGSSLLSWRRCELPLGLPRDRVAIGRVDDDLLVVLAGGIRHSLDVYFIESGGAITRHATDGGRRLPPAFNRGGGSWPVAVGRTAFVFAFAKDGRIDLHAVGLEQQVFARRSLPEAATGFDVAVDQKQHKIRVQPLGVPGAHPLEFSHPGAPRVEFAAAVLDFDAVRVGEAKRGWAEIRNPTRHPVDVAMVADGSFVVHENRCSVPPLGSVTVPVSFVADTPGSHRGRIVAKYAGVEQALVLPLRGEAVDRSPDRAPVPAVPQARGQSHDPGSVEAVPVPAGTGADDGKVRPETAPQPVDAPGPAGGAGTVATPAKPRPLRLVRAGDTVVVHGLPREDVLLVTVDLERDRGRVWPLRTRTAWYATLGPRGTLPLTIDALTDTREGVGLLALRPVALRADQSNLEGLQPLPLQPLR
jgi:hypothetical protein